MDDGRPWRDGSEREHDAAPRAEPAAPWTSVPTPAVAPPLGPMRERPRVQRRWLILTAGAMAAVTLALAVVSVFWVTARQDVAESRVALEETRAHLEQERSDREGAEDEVASLEARVDGMRRELTGAERTIGRAKTCLRGIAKAFRTADIEVFRSIKSDCNAVWRARAGGSETQ